MFKMDTRECQTTWDVSGRVREQNNILDGGGGSLGAPFSQPGETFLPDLPMLDQILSPSKLAEHH